MVMNKVIQDKEVKEGGAGKAAQRSQSTRLVPGTPLGSLQLPTTLVPGTTFLWLLQECTHRHTRTHLRVNLQRRRRGRGEGAGVVTGSHFYSLSD